MKSVEHMKEHIKLVGTARGEVKDRVKLIAARIKQGRQEQRGEHSRTFAQRLSNKNGSTVS